MDHLEHAFKGSVKKEYNIEYYRTHKDKWKKTKSDQSKYLRGMKRSIKTSKHNNSTQAFRAQQTAYNEAIKSINQSKKVYKKYARKFNIANAANIIETGINFIEHWLSSGN